MAVAKKKDAPKALASDYSLTRLLDPCDRSAAAVLAVALIIADSVLSLLIIKRVPYTKIDWDAYMSQVDGFLGGERDYSKLRGDTGPLVYPAGFLYAFSGLKYLTNGSVPQAQVLFAILYSLNLAVVMAIIIRTKTVPPWALLLLCLSKRVHSIFVLRLFNDCVAMFFAYASVLLFQSRKWYTGMVVFSLAVSVKMNILLFAPPLLLLLLKDNTWVGVFLALSYAAAVQVLLGLPFLLTYPMAYISNAFNFGRVFIYFWSVNFKFLPEALFLSKQWAITLLLGHLAALLLFAKFKWTRSEGGILRAIGVDASKPAGKGAPAKAPTAAQGGSKEDEKKPALTPEHVTTLLFTGNFIGILFARSLHYQFYSWYFHTIPYLLWRTKLPTHVRLLLWLMIEISWNVYPSDATSSFVLLVSHALLLLGLAIAPALEARAVDLEEEDKTKAE